MGCIFARSYDKVYTRLEEMKFSMKPGGFGTVLAEKDGEQFILGSDKSEVVHIEGDSRAEITYKQALERLKHY